MDPPHRARRVGWLLLAAAVAGVDLWSKGLWKYPDVIGGAPQLERTLIDGWLYIRTIWNTGGVWSMPLPQGLLFAATLLAVPGLALWLFWPARAHRIESAGKALVLGGAAGNLYDRLLDNAVRDFIDVCFGDPKGWHWPTFNGADIALVAGIVLLLLRGLQSTARTAGAKR